jgi:predicted permease
MDRELEEEFRFHLDMEIEKNRRAGMSDAEARRVSRVAFGGVDRMTEAHRDWRGSRLLDDAVSDLRYAKRALARTPGFVVISIATLAVSIAIGTAVFTGANAFFYRPLPVPDGASLLSVFTSDWSGRDKAGASSYADIVDLAREVDPVADIAGETRIMLSFSVADNVAYEQGAVVTSSYFRVVGVRPFLGRFPVSSEIPAIVIGHTLWRKIFGSDSSIVGRTVRVNGQPFTVAAIAPPEFRGVSRENAVNFWIDGRVAPLVLMRDELFQRRGYRGFRVAGRLRHGASLAELNGRLSLAAAHLFQTYPRDWRDTTGGGRVVTALREQDAHLASIPRGELLLMLAAVLGFGFGLVIIACMNLASMQLARGASRRREIATRLALGAGRGRIVRQLLAECGLVALPGIVIGVGLSYTVAALLSHYRPIPIPSLDFTLDWRSIAFISVTTIIALLVFGLMPALQTVRADLASDLKGSDVPGIAGLRIGRMRGSLIVAQVAFSVLFTASAAIAAIGIDRFASSDRGDAQRIMVSRLNFLPTAGDSSQVASTFADVLAEIKAIPGVQGASAAVHILLRGDRMSVYGETRTAAGELKKRELDANYIRPEYFKVIGLPILRGRDFEQRDRASTAVIISKSMAGALWPGEDALGKKIRVEERAAPSEVVGVVVDPSGFEPATDRSYPGLIYLPFSFTREAEVTLHVRVPSAGAAIANQINEILRRYNTSIVAPKPITLDEYYDRTLLPLRVLARASAAIALFQFMLAIAGLSGLVAYVTELRRREIGIRTALGATKTSVLRLVTRQALRLTAMGASVGLVLSAGVATAMADALPITPAIVTAGLLLAAGVFGLVGTISMLLPARRALEVAPSVALRAE